MCNQFFRPRATGRMEFSARLVLRTNVAGFVHELRGLRNYVHPGVWSREQKPLRFTKGVFNVVFEIFEVANDWLLHHVHKSMLKKIERAKRPPEPSA
jgi:hypothetical protein